MEIDHHRPAATERGRVQLLTIEEANDSRLITKCRWVVESRKGHVKFLFEFFKNTIPRNHVINLREFHLIAGTIMNRYVILIGDATQKLARAM